MLGASGVGWVGGSIGVWHSLWCMSLGGGLGWNGVGGLV